MTRTTTKLIMAAMMLSTSAFAQNTKMMTGLKPNSGTHQHAGTPTVSAKSTAMASRPIGASTYNFDNGVNYQLEDTTFLTYTGERGADSLLNEIKFDLLIRQEVLMNVYTNDSKTNQTFDANDNILTSLDQTWNVGLSTWENDRNTTNTYDVSNNLLTSIDQNWNTGTNMWDNSSKYNYTYDMNNNMLTEVYQYWNNGTMAWVNSSKYLYSYDVNNHVTTYIYQYWDAIAMAWVNSSRQTYTYDVNNDMIASLYESWNIGTNSWDNSSQHMITYDGNHHALVDISQNNVLGVWQNNEKLTYTYNGDDITSLTGQQWNNVGSVWENTGKYLFAYDANHNRISQITQNWNSGTNAWDNNSRQQMTYNNYHQFTSVWTDQWNSGIWEVTTSDEKFNIYYEEYNVTGIENVASANDLKVYPVPAQNFVRVEKTWAQPQDFTVSITDMQGRLVRTFSEKATSNYSRSIDVNQLASGNYVIKIAPKSGKVSYQKFSVMH